MDNNVRIMAIGHLELAPKETQDIINDAITKTKDNTGLKLVFAFIYGGRDEIVEATKAICEEYKEGKIGLDDITEDYFESHLMTKELPPVDLMIRSSGECRLSNFLLWQLSYAEFIFDEAYWPDFNAENYMNVSGSIRTETVVMEESNNEAKNHNSNCISSAFLPCVIVSGIPFKILMAFIGVMATYELLSITKEPKPHFYLYIILGAYILGSLFFSKGLLVSNMFIVIYMVVLLTCGIFDAGMPFLRISYYLQVQL